MNAADRIRLRHMLDAAEEALLIAEEGSRVSLLAVMKDIEIIGEAASKVSLELRNAEPGVPWRDIVGMRNRLIHAYFEVEPSFVWATVSRDLPLLVIQLRDILAREEADRTNTTQFGY